ncbi:MAG: DUF58 domain-containing protein [Oxalicibacterium faecigallinarum]|uniref:DUF58 domain-containing protein n=1 Tax=Oxalicibacterium faecigallinarum TaxID=573741 RepID=UPI0028094E90|nr:DUF58 domain-containing protein [Oxalicibacterium faecigallinarum]MDQ7969017.1 DUF58 domain-containing protein [Oxalicibacterium faecigallinarum]
MFKLREAEEGEVFLKQRRVFIVPTRAGLMFGVMLIVLFLCSINYSLSLGFALTFLLAGCAVIDMHLTFRNLAHLYLSPGRTQAVFAGEIAQFSLHLRNQRKHGRYALHLTFIDTGTPAQPQLADVPADGSVTVSLGISTTQRGWLPAPPIRLHTTFPLGLLRAWSYWQPAAQVLIYPAPEAGEPALPLHTGGTEMGHGLAGQDDFAGIRAYQAGDSIRHMAWRQIARSASGALVTKQFEGGASARLVLDYSRIKNLDTEQKLARMTRWVLMAEAQGLPYAFTLGTTHLPFASGPAHLSACLQALALYERAA